MNINSSSLAKAIRFLCADCVEKAKSGHPGMPLGMADVATTLFEKHLKFHPLDPHWPDRDRFILSAGHGSTLLYSLLYLTGYEDISIEELKKFRQLGARTAGHPEFGEAAGIETTTGPLGQGLGNGVGFALAEKILAQQFGADLVDHYTYVIAGDGCLMEGLCQEAISLAGHLKLSKLIVLWDDNDITIDGPTHLTTCEDQVKRFEAACWDVQAIDGHDAQAIDQAISRAKTTSTPSLICCKTKIGYGALGKEGTSQCHGAPLGESEIKNMRQHLDWPYEPFDIPDEIFSMWRMIGMKGQACYKNWQTRLENADHEKRIEFLRRINGILPEKWQENFQKFKKDLTQKAPAIASRKASQITLESCTPFMPEMVGGSADLTGSNNTKTPTTHLLKDITSPHHAAYIHWGVREHGMAAAMNGLALHGGFIPYGGTFLVFSDYCRPSIRLSALMKQQVIYVMTHDSIGLGEDGPTHQPIEHLAALRAMPGLRVIRPADAIETAEAWEYAINEQNGPTLLALTRQNLTPFRTTYEAENHVAQGAYLVTPEDPQAVSTIIASGSEVNIALQAHEKLKNENIITRVVSMPCWENFEDQSHEYQNQVLGTKYRIAIEALSPMGWERYVGHQGTIIGINSFGASGPIDDLYKYFGITVESVIKAVKKKI